MSKATKSSAHLRVAPNDSAPGLKPEQLKKIHKLMLEARLLEERLIRMYKQNDGYFWIGGPGEEAFNIPLGLLTHKGEGKDFDYLHLHYRSAAILHAMGADPMDAMRQMKNTATDPYSGGRNFANHFSKREWNVVPVTSTIATQYATAIGSAIAQKRHGGKGITIVNGGDAGTAEGEFQSCLLWATRPENELPILIIVTNNEWGISTPTPTQQGARSIADRAKPFGMPARVIDGNNVEESWQALNEAMDYIRKERKPYFIEARVSRLYGHSSATGCNFVTEEADPLFLIEKRLEEEKITSRKQMDEMREKIYQKYQDMANRVKKEPMPDPSSIYDYTYKDQKGRYF